MSEIHQPFASDMETKMLVPHQRKKRRTAISQAASRLALCGLFLDMSGTLPAAAQAPQSNMSAEPAKAGAADPQFQSPYIDIDEWRDAPVRHRYVHGGFKGTDTRFSFYFPEKAKYQGRFFQHITPVPDNENQAPKVADLEENKIGFSIDSGAYFVETNGGGANNVGSSDPTLTAYRANAAAADYSRVVARKMYGGKRPYGYAFGGSGGGYRTIGSIENTQGVWDGVVPFVIGSPVAMPNVFTVRIHAMRNLWHKFPQILDAIEPGGSGDPYAGLTEDEAAALREVTKMGFPMGSWFGYETMGVHGFSAIYPIIKAVDPSYFQDFWTKPGYLGFDRPASLASARVTHQTTIKGPVSAREAQAAGVVLRRADGGVDNAFLGSAGENANKTVGFHLATPVVAKDFLGGDLVIRSGLAAGKFIQVTRIVGDMVILGPSDAALVAKIKPGDEVTLDTSDFLAAQTYHRHQDPGPGFPEWDQFRNTDGSPIFPQRPMELGPMITRGTVGGDMTGKINGKMIVVASLWDREAYPWQADWYARQVRKQLGARTDDNFRLWYTDRALHGDELHQEDPTRTVGYIGVLQQALRDVSAWAEKGVKPPASTGYQIIDGQVVVSSSTDKRQGIQPVVDLSVNGGKRAEVRVGEPVTFLAAANLPAGTGKLVEARWDMEGSGTYPLMGKLVPSGTGMRVETSFKFTAPGTYFPTIRVVSQREGKGDSPYGRIYALDNVRVIVK